MSQYDDDYGVRSPGQKPIDPFDVVVKTSPAEPDAMDDDDFESCWRGKENE